MNERKIIVKWWWPWQAEKIEGMLESFALQGWIFELADFACMRFVFTKREPARIRYCVDYQDKEKPDYLAILTDAGWEMKHRSSGWYIWGKAYSVTKPELFTDIDSLIRRNNTILASLVAVLAAQLPLIIVSAQNIAKASPVALAFYALWGLFEAMLAGMVVGMAIGAGKLARRKTVAGHGKG